ncbi:hypothetical protein ACFZB9_30860 [Kitasatospora sp. NPDC008050]
MRGVVQEQLWPSPVSRCPWVLTLRGYLLIAVILVIVKVVQMYTG